MNIYTKKGKDMRNMMIKFINTVYGKITFLLSYSLFFFFTIVSIILFIYKEELAFLIYSLLLALITFIFGSIHYYKELRIFIRDIDLKINE